MRARDIMATPVHTVRDVDTIDDVAALLAGGAVAAAPVLDGDGVVVGVISEGDVPRGRLAAAIGTAIGTATIGAMVPAIGTGAVEKVAAAEVMTRTVVCVSPEAEVAEVAKALLDRGVHSAPVVDDGQLVGIIGQRDVFRTLIRDDDVVHRDVRHRLDEYAGRDGDRLGRGGSWRRRRATTRATTRKGDQHVGGALCLAGVR